MSNKKSIDKKNKKINKLLDEAKNCNEKKRASIVIKLLKYLGDESGRVRFRAVDALGIIGDKRAIGPIRLLLMDKDTAVLQSVPFALARLNGRSAIQDIRNLLNNKHDLFGGVRKSAISALGYLWTSSDNEILDLLLDSLADDDEYVRYEAAKVLEETGHPEWIKVINPPSLNEKSYFDILAELAYRGIKQAFSILVNKLKNDSYNNYDKKRAAKTLSKLTNPEVVEPLLYALNKNYETLYVSRALMDIGNDEAIEGLIKALDHKNEDVRHHSATACGYLEDSRTTDALIDALHDDSWYVREAVVRALGCKHEVRAVKPLVDALLREIELVKKDWDLQLYQVADEIIKALGKYRKPEAADLLYSSLKNKAPAAKAMLALSLGYMGDTRAVEPLIDGFKNNAADISIKTIKVLGDLKDKKAVDVLIQEISEGNATYKGYVIESLCKIGDTKALDSLKNALNDENYTVRDSAKAAIALIEEQNSI